MAKTKQDEQNKPSSAEKPAVSEKIAAVTAALDELDGFRRGHCGSEFVGRDPNYDYFSVSKQGVGGVPKHPNEDGRLLADLARFGWEKDESGVYNMRDLSAVVYRREKEIGAHILELKRRKAHQDKLWVAMNKKRSTEGYGFVDDKLLPTEMRESL
jgi:hypothetical protein